MNQPFHADHAANAVDVAAVRDRVITAYCNGAFNALDTATMREGFHPDFAILGADQDRMDRYTIDAWITAIEQRKSAPGFDPAGALRACELLCVDVTGDAAHVKMQVRRDDALLYTDHLLLLRFASGWKIVSKVYHEHV